MTVERQPVRRALLSVSDKSGLVPFAAGLAERGFELVSTTGGFGDAADDPVPTRADGGQDVFHFHGTVDAVQGFPHTLALASCRRRVVGSCTNYDGFVPITLLEKPGAKPRTVDVKFGG